MTPGKYNIEIWRGSTWTIGINAEELDFTDYDVIRMQIRPPWVKGIPVKPALLELSMANGRITLEDDNLTLRLTISADDTTDLSFDEGAYDLELIQTEEAGEVVDKLLYGSVSVKGERTV